MSPAKKRTRSGRRVAGFTLVEMLVVVALLGIVAALALPRYRHATVRAKESVLKHDLWVMRDVIDQFFTDQGRYPSALEELAQMGYLRKIPVDPFTEEAVWEEIFESIGEEDTEADDYAEPGVTDVRSFATGLSLDGTTYYYEW